MKLKDLLPYIEGGETVVIVNNDYAKCNADYKRLVENYGEREVKGISAYLNELYITLEEEE